MEANYLTILCWFCHTSTCIHHRNTRVPHPEPPSLLPPDTIPLGHPSAPAPSIQYHVSNLDWRFSSYVILYMFQCHSPKSSLPLPSPTESKRLFYTSMSLLLSHIQGYPYIRVSILYWCFSFWLTFTFYFDALEKEMATHSSVLAWRIPRTGKPGGLPSMGLHSVGHD